MKSQSPKFGFVSTGMVLWFWYIDTEVASREVLYVVPDSSEPSNVSQVIDH